MLSVRQALRMPKGEALLAHILKVSSAHLYAYPERVLQKEEEIEFSSLHARFLQGEPLAYLLGRQEFWSLDFIVTKDVLVPRPETEILVECILRHCDATSLQVADLGTGSGAIAIALANERPAWEIYATDISSAALQVAKQNADRLHASHIQFAEGVWLQGLPNKLFDVIVSNPPYVDSNDPYLEQDVRKHEPSIALFSKEDGMSDLTHLIKESYAYLKPGGFLFLEHGFLQAERIRRIFAEVGYTGTASVRDLSGLERVTYGKK